MCSKCYDSRKRLYQKMNNAIELRKDNLALTTKKSVFDCLPGLLLNQHDMLIKDRKKEQSLRYIARKKLKMLKNRNGGDNLSLDPNKFKPDILFDDQLTDLVKTHFGTGTDASTDGVINSSIQKYILDECFLQSWRASKSWEKAAGIPFLSSGSLLY